MKDMIDERNFREKCARSIVKSYNVHYIMPDETEEKQEEAAKTQEDTSKSVLDDESRWAHVPSAGYGKIKESDPVTEEQIRKILGQQSEGTLELLAELEEH